MRACRHTGDSSTAATASRVATSTSAAARGRTLAFAGVVVGLLAVTLLSAGCTSAPAQKPLAASLPAEATLRALRLVGIDRAAVGEQGSTVTLRVQVPSLSSAGDVEIAWQAGMGVLAESYPNARRYVVRLASAEGEPLVEFEVGGSKARKAVDRGDAAGLRDAATVRYLSGGEGAMPSDSLAVGPTMGAGTVTAEYLDAKNRAADLVSADGGPAYALLGAREASATRAAVPGRPAPAVDQDAATVLSGVLRSLLARRAADEIEGADALRALADDTTASGPERVLALRRWIAVADATTTQKPFGDVTDAANATAQAVTSAKLPSLNDSNQGGLRSAAILVAARVPGAPAEMKVVTRFVTGADAPSVDVRQARVDTATTASPEQTAAVRAYAERLALESRGDGSAPTVSWETSAGVKSVSALVWPAYTRRDGRIFWLLGEGGPAALTDASVDGWAWNARRIDIVDAADVGRVLSTIELR